MNTELSPQIGVMIKSNEIYQLFFPKADVIKEKKKTIAFQFFVVFTNQFQWIKKKA